MMAGQADPPRSAQLPLRLRVTRAEHLAEGVLGLTLSALPGECVPAWAPGAHIDLRLPSGTSRSYSLCGDPQSPAYQVAVSLDAGSRGGSREIFETQLVGRIVSASVPGNDFELVDAPEYLFIAGGIGITPILSMLRAVSAEGRPWLVYYLGRSRSRLGFLEELTAIGGSGQDRCRVLIGDEGHRLSLGDILTGVRPGTAAYCCGPNRLMDEAISIHAASGGHFTLHVERFGRPDLKVTDAAGSSPVDPCGDDGLCDPDGPFEVELRKTGVVVTVQPGESILGAARKVRSGLTYNCSSGYCGTCETRVISGLPDHRDEVLSADEKQAGATMMICVSRSRTRRLTIDL